MIKKVLGKMSGYRGVWEKEYVLLKNFKVDFKTNDEAEEGNGRFILSFWLYIDHCAFPSVILEQKRLDTTRGTPFLYLDEKKKLALFPLPILHQEAPDDNSVPLMGVPRASSETEFPLKKWVHIGCEVLLDLVRLHIGGELVGEKPVTSMIKNDLHADVLKKIFLACPDANKDIFRGYVHGLDVSFPTSTVKTHHVKDPPVQLSIDHSSASEIEEDSDGVWSIVGGKASCRRIFSLDVVLLDAFGCPVNKELEVVASLLYADNEAPVENTSDAEPPLLMSYDGIEYTSIDRPCKLINGRASFKLKISQLSSKCENRLFRIRFDIPQFGKYRFLETLSLPIRCVSRNRNMRTAALTGRKASNKFHCVSGYESLTTLDDGSVERIPTIIREAKPSPSSKRIKLGQDKPFAMLKEDFPLKQVNNKEFNSHALTGKEDDAYGMSVDRRPENHYGAENSSASESNEATNSDPKSMHSVSSPISDSIVFKYCLGGPVERCQLLKEISISATEEQLSNFAKQVSLYSGCLHHSHQIKIAKRLFEEGIQIWTSVSENNQHVLWETLVFRINESFMKIACCTRSLTAKDFECLRRIAGCQDMVSEEYFERMWYWLYPIARSLSKSAVNAMWDSLAPLWLEGFITKEEAEFTLQSSGSLQDPGTFVLRFPTSRSWPHPDAGNLVVTYVGSDHTIHHRLLSLDFIDSSSSKEMKPLQNMLLEEPELSRLATPRRIH